MEIVEAINRFGAEAVRRYREISDAKNEDEVPEVFITNYMAPRLSEALQCNVKVERRYDVIANEHGLALSAEVQREMRLLRADLTVYRSKKPAAIIEIKKFSDANLTASIAHDLVVKFSLFGRSLPFYEGILICQSAKDETLQARVQSLARALGHSIDCGEPLIASSAKWQWCFGCIVGREVSVGRPI